MKYEAMILVVNRNDFIFVKMLDDVWLAINAYLYLSLSFKASAAQQKMCVDVTNRFLVLVL